MEDDLYKHMTETEKYIFDRNVRQASTNQGLYQQIQQSNTIRYNTISLNLIEDVLYDISGFPNKNNSDPLWLEYKTETDPKLGIKYPTQSYGMVILDIIKTGMIIPNKIK